MSVLATLYYGTSYPQSVCYVAYNHEEADPRISYLCIPRGIWTQRCGELCLKILVSKTDSTAKVLRPESVTMLGYLRGEREALLPVERQASPVGDSSDFDITGRQLGGCQVVARPMKAKIDSQITCHACMVKVSRYIAHFIHHSV